MAKFFKTPFGQSGDKTPIPDPATGDGSVSYSEGFGIDYERNPATDPAAKRIPREETNSLYFEITEALQQYQLNGFPDWVDAATNGGTPVAYALGAFVRMPSGVVYGSTLAANTQTPGVGANWVVLEPVSVPAIAASAAEINAPATNAKFPPVARLATAMRESKWTYLGLASRAAGAYTIAAPAGVAYSQPAGTRVEFAVPDASPAGPLTLKVGALAAMPLQTSTEAVLAAGDLVAGRTYAAISTGAKWLLVAPVPSQLVNPFTLPARLSALTQGFVNVTDVDDADENGWYYAAPGVTNGPAEIAAYSLYVLAEMTTGSSAQQTAQAAGGGNATNTRTYKRIRSGGTWGPWFRLYDSAPEIQQVAVPPGTIIHTAGSAAPNGYIKADGAAVSRTDYAALFAVIGTTYGPGNGTTTFNVPDLRAEFVRGWDDGRGIDPGRARGSAQAAQVGPHVHPLADMRPINARVATPILPGQELSSAGIGDVVDSAPNSGAENRPRNVALLACIKT